MRHQLAVNYDAQEDEKLLKLMRFHSTYDQQSDPKISRILRLAANRIEELQSLLDKETS